MAGTVILIILFVLCILLMLPLRVKFSFGDGKWAVKVYYAFFRVFRKESEPPPPPPAVPPKPDDLPDGASPSKEQMPEPEPVPDTPPKPEAAASPDADAEAETVSDAAAAPEEQPAAAEVKDDAPADTESAAESADGDAETADELEQTEEKPEKPKKRGFVERLKPHSLSDVTGLISDGCGALSPSLRALMRHLHFRHVKLWLTVGADDPADAALLYGRICAAAFPLLGTLQSLLDFQTDEFRILADFYGSKLDFRVSFELRLSPMAALFAVLILGSKFLWRTLVRFRREDKEEKRRIKESAPIS